MKHITFKKVKTIAQGRWGSILSTLGGQDMNDAIERGHARHGVCPIHQGNKPFRVFRDFEDTGGCICSQCGAFNDGFSFLQEMYHWSNSEVLDQVASNLGLNNRNNIVRLPPKKIIKVKEIPTEQIEVRKQAIQKLWNEASEINQPGSEPMLRYLLNRGIEQPNALSSKAIKMALSHGYYEDDKIIGHYNTMLAPVIDPNGICVALHRTYITFNGLKAPVECPKKLYTKGTSLKGAAIQLFPAAEEMGVSEGIETALAVNQMNGMSVWPCISAALLRQVHLPTIVKRLHIWTDKDRSLAGQEAAEALSEIQYERGIEVTIHLPEQDIPADKKSIDWLDVYNLKKTHQAPTLRRTA